MTYPRLSAGDRPIAAAGFRQMRQRLAYVHQQEQGLQQSHGFRRAMIARTCERLRCETRLQLVALRQVLHALFG